MTSYVLIGVIVGVFFAGLGIGFAVFMTTYNPYQAMFQNPMFNNMMANNPQFAGQYMGYMMQNPQYMNQWFSQNPQYEGQWMGTMIQNPQLRQQMYNYMFQNKDFMYNMMGNPNFQSQYMGPWMMQNPQFQKQWLAPSAPQNQFNGTIARQPAASSGYYMGPGMMGSGYNQGYQAGPGMMGSGYGQSIKTISISDAESATQLQNYAQASKENNTITFNSQSVSIVPLSFMGDAAKNFTSTSPPTYAKDDVFVIGNLIDPTLVVKPGTVLNVTSINLDDDMSHNFVIMASGPPYPYMAMQSMMYGGIVATMPVLPNDDGKNGFAYEYSYTVTLSQPGTYWYVCTYPGHAQDGMYGKIIVQ
ncbi:MAG: hypothetical protein KGI25_02820 [Thaumarchaeota archaeon]|nr:hypothetical protein [Nitrososphaerota archaeon]